MFWKYPNTLKEVNYKTQILLKDTSSFIKNV